MAFNPWTFTIANIVIPNGWEPIGWDKVKFTLRRAQNDVGYDFTFSDSLELDGLAGQIVRQAYEAEFIDAYVTVVIEHCQGWKYEGVINFSLYKEKAKSISVGIKESSFSNLFTNRYETPVDLSKEVGLEGNPLTPITPINLPLHSKELFFTAEYRINPILSPYTFEKAPGITIKRPDHVPPLQVSSSDIEQDMEPSDYNAIYDQPIFYSGFQYPAGIASRSILVEGRYRVTVNATKATGGVYNQCLRLKVKGVQTEIVTSAINLGCVTIGTGITEIDIPFSVTVQMPPDSNLFFYYGATADDNANSEAFSDFTFNYDLSATILKLSERSVFPASTAKAYLVYEALNRVLENITGVSDVLRSNFLGRLDSIPLTYTADGRGALTALTNGFALRRFEGRPVVTSFKEVFEGLNAIYNLGLRVEGQKIRIEPKEYFYQLGAPSGVNAIRHTFIPDLQENISLPDIYSEVEFDYQNQGDTKQLNKLDEFNTKRNYITPIRQHKNKLEIRTSVITSGYAIEFTRRQQYSSNGTTDYPTDNNLFFIALLRQSGGFRPERNEGYGTISNLISPSTSYNLRFSPVRCLLRWRKIYAGALWRSPNAVVKFVSGTGNYELIAAGISEKQDIPAVAQNALFRPIEVLFSYPMTFGEFLDLKTKAVNALYYSCDNNEFKAAFIREVTYEPNREGGIAQFKLIQANGNRNETITDA